MRSARRGDGALLPPLLPLTARLERAFAAQGSELPAATRSLLLVAAADDDDDVAGEVLSAAVILGGSGVTVDDFEPAVAARLVEIGGTLRFRHPLVRSALYQAAALSQRQAAHAALSEVLAGQPDRRAWHRAAAALGRDGQVAAELDEAATRAERRGAIAVAISALERAAELSESPASQGSRLLRAATLAFERPPEPDAAVVRQMAPPPAASRSVHPNGIDTIILIHGLWVTALTWEHWIGRYRARGYRVLAPQLAGRGRGHRRTPP